MTDSCCVRPDPKTESGHGAPPVMAALAHRSPNQRLVGSIVSWGATFHWHRDALHNRDGAPHHDSVLFASS
jgi:hypothetical protein